MSLICWDFLKTSSLYKVFIVIKLKLANQSQVLSCLYKSELEHSGFCECEAVLLGY